MLVRVQSAATQQSGIYYEYETESLPLGQGGMGVVYQGYCYREGDRSQYIPVAIKRIANSNQDLINRAMREASVRVDHKNLLMMWDFIPNFEVDPATGTNVVRHYIIMDCLQGVNLDNLLSQNFRDKFNNECVYAKELYSLYLSDRGAFVRTVFLDVLNGVKALHDAGFIHRDLDPSNIMITHDREIKIIDFGISKNINESAGSSQKLTSVGSMMGKIDYAAPEMITGDVNHHNKTTDIYALGIIAYQLCVGELPFQGDTGAVAKCQLDTPVPVEKITDPVIRQIVRKATQKEQANRYQDISEMLDAFNRLTTQVNIEEYEKEFRKLNEYSSEDRLRDFLARNPDGRHTDEVQRMLSQRIEEDAFKKLSADSSKEDLSAFLSEYPDSRHRKEVHKWLKGKSNSSSGSVPAWVWIVFPIVGVIIGVILNLVILW